MNVVPTSAETDLDPALIFDRIRFEGLTSVLVAVSGGGDSLALLYLLARLSASRLQFPAIVAVTVDHKLRAEAAEEARYVAMLCGELGVAHRTLEWGEPKPDTGLSAMAREARYRLLCQAAREAGTDLILTGHTLDDQIETYAMREQRTREQGSERGLAAMAPATLLEREIWLVRPLLRVTREALRNYLRARNIAWRDDPSNDDLKYERVRVRKTLRKDERELILAKIAAKTEQRRAQNTSAERLLQQSVTVRDGTLAAIDKSSFRGDVDAQRLAIGVLLAAMGGLSLLPPAEICEKAIRHIAGEGTSRRISLGRCVIEVRRDKALILRELRSLPKITVGPGETAIWDGRFRLVNWTQGAVGIEPIGDGRLSLLREERVAVTHWAAVRSSPAISAEGELICLGSCGDHAKLPAGISLARHLALFDHILSGYDVGLAQGLAELFRLPPYKRLPVNQINKN
ncbi:MAG: tRNA lysidine(34) synthetase TilS [Phyllobacterium sp.]|uniref:tRNA lysidine(34) synthetase TilS n=1 Tax=Phyllobacterium sp. TaxID=1871046 RepID=UPI0030F33D7B